MIDPAPLDLVTGANGLTGRAIVDALLAAGRRVRTLDLAPFHDTERVESVCGDIRDATTAERACAGVDTVFHTAAIVSQHPAWAARLHDVNVNGTRTMLAAAKACGVARFVFTSSIDVVFDGRAIANGDESLAYPTVFLDDYARTKAEAERAVLAADDPHGMATCALRTAGIYGPHDRNRFPVMLDHVRRHGFVAMGDGRAKFSHVYVDNVAHAHLLAARALRPGSPVAGKAYFITDHAASNFFDFAESYFTPLGIPRSRFAIPERLAWAIAMVVEGLYKLAGDRITKPPTLTRYSVAATCRNFHFGHGAATRDFGYEPIVNETAARERTLAWLRTLPTSHPRRMQQLP